LAGEAQAPLLVYTHNQAMSFTRHGFFCGHWSKLFAQLHSLTLPPAANLRHENRFQDPTE